MYGFTFSLIDVLKHPPCHCALCGDELPPVHSPDHLCPPCFDIVADYVVDHAKELLGLEGDSADAKES